MQNEKFERMRAEALAALPVRADVGFGTDADDETNAPIPRCQPRPQPRPRHSAPPAGDENALEGASGAVGRVRAAARAAAPRALGAAVAADNALADGGAPAACDAREEKALAAAVAARTEGLRHASEAMASAHDDLLDYTSSVDNLLARLQALDRLGKIA